MFGQNFLDFCVKFVFDQQFSIKIAEIFHVEFYIFQNFCVLWYKKGSKAGSEGVTRSPVNNSVLDESNSEICQLPIPVELIIYLTPLFRFQRIFKILELRMVIAPWNLNKAIQKIPKKIKTKKFKKKTN